MIGEEYLAKKFQKHYKETKCKNTQSFYCSADNQELEYVQK